MKVREYLRVDKWNDFVINHPKGNIFQSPEMYEVYLNTENFEPVFLVVTSNNDDVLGILLAVIQKEYSGILGNVSSRSIIIGGPLIKNNDCEILKLVLKAYNTKIKNRVVFSQFRNLWNWREFKNIFQEAGFIYDSHLDILIDITKDEDEIWTSLDSKARNKIRKAKKTEIEFKVLTPTDELVDKSYLILQDIYRNAKIPLANIGLFRSCKKVLSDKNMIKYFCAIKDNEIIGVRIGLLYKNMIYDWYAGSLKEFYKFNPNDFLPYSTLVWGHNNKFEVFDFGGAGKPNVPYGVRDHKMKFGGQLVEYGRFEKVHKPKLMAIAKAGLELYKLVN